MSTVLRVSTHIYGVSQGDRWENIHFSSKPMHVTPQVGCLREMIHWSEGFNTHL